MTKSYRTPGLKIRLQINHSCLCCTGWNTTTTTSMCPEGMTGCLFEEVITLDYMVYFNFFGCVLVPLVIMLIIYAHIFMAARRQLRLKVAHTPAPGEITTSSNSTRSTLQREVHAAKSLAIIVGLFAVCWLPLHIINCFNHLCQSCDRPHIWVMNIAIILSHANSVVNPFIYAFRIREFRLTFRRILYQHILGKGGGHGFENSVGRGVENSSIKRSSSHSSKEGSSCITVVNNYIVEPSSNQTPPKAINEACCHCTSKLDTEPSSNIPNGNQIQDNAVSTLKEQKCITPFAVQDGVVSHTQGTADVLEVKDSGSCVTFVNVHAVSVKQTDCACSKEFAEVS